MVFMFWQTTRFQIDLERPQIMGIVNVTPDSFSDGGQHDTTAKALAAAAYYEPPGGAAWARPGP